ncbi:UDP-4-amino-4,6-dideoxy-N-acetyl-beta-L-altrosamine transaminase, partial [Candidatus Omnitrophota bacterium]
MKPISYARQKIDNKDIKAVVDVLRSDYVTQGPKADEFEKKVADYCGAKYAVALNSGTSALHAACFAAGIKSGDEVITSPISFAASANCILYCGARPRFVDILEDTVTIDPYLIEKKISSKTKAIIPVDFAGHPAELSEIRKIASKYNLTVIEDAAHALGAEYKGKKVGSCKFSDMTVLSFHAVKHITTGEGGMVLTNRKDLYDKLSMFKTHGITRDRKLLLDKKNPPWFYEMQFLGFNYRITDIQCALGLSQMDKLDNFVKKRRKIVQFYKEQFKDTRVIGFLNEKKYAMSSWHIFPIRVKKKRDMMFDRLKQRGIGVNVHYIPIYLHPYYKDLDYKKGLCPKAEQYYKETITLPLHPVMSDADVKKVVRVTKEVLRN